MQKNIAPFLIVVAVLIVGVIGIFMLSNQKVSDSAINFNPTLKPTDIPTPTSDIINIASPTAEITPFNMDNTKATSSGLKIEDTTVGTGNEVKSGDTITVQYAGYLENGTKFDSSYDRNTPLTIQIGVGHVIKGWDEGIIGMKVGGKRKLFIPSDLGYGAQGSGDSIPPNSNLIFDVELLEVK